MFEVVVNQPRLVRHTRQRRVVPHRTERIFLRLDHRDEHELQHFGRVTERLHLLEQRRFIVARRSVRIRQFREPDPLASQPFLVRSPHRNRLLQFFIRDQPALLEVHEEHLAGLQPPFHRDVLRRDVEHSDFGRHHDFVVFRDVVTARPQSVPIQHCADVVPVGERDRRRAVPRFLQRREVFVERPLLFRHRVMILPRFRDHHHYRFGQRPAGVVQQLQRIVEVARVRAVRLANRKQLLQIAAEEFRLHHALPSVHPVDVASQRVDLAVVSHESARLSAVPTWKCVRREPRVNHRQMALVVRVAQVEEIRHDLRRHQHPFEDDDPRRQRANVKQQCLRQLRLIAQPMAGHFADDEKLSIEGRLIESLFRTDEQHLHRRLS